MRKFFFSLVLILNIYCSGQETYNIKTYDLYLPKYNLFAGEGNWHFANEYFYYSFTPSSGRIGALKLIVRVIKIYPNEDEGIYSSYEEDVDPDWESYFNQIKLQKGKYRFKIYSTNGELLGQSDIKDIIAK